MPNAPVQVVLNADAFRRDRERPQRVSAGKDFFEGRDQEFSQHQRELRSQVKKVAEDLRTTGYLGSGYVKVKLRSSAVAKSHRPVEKVFATAQPVGGGRLGEIVAQVDLTSVGSIEKAIERAEVEVAKKIDAETGEERATPTRFRCEVGAIERIEMWGKGDRRRFDISDALRWLSSPRTGQSYIVQLFSSGPSSRNDEDRRKMFASLVDGLGRFLPGIRVVQQGESADGDGYIEVMLTTDRQAHPLLVSRRSRDDKVRTNFDPNEKRHAQLLAFLEAHPLVREIQLPNILVRSAVATGSIEPFADVPLPKRAADQPYPRVGIVDGGISGEQSEWVIYQHGLLAPAHTDGAHGSFIGGLVIAARAMNKDLSTEADGFLIADVDIFPADKPGNFEQYYPNGISDFFDELETAVAACRQQHGVRVFNLSLNVVSPIALDRYSLEARRLDAIADAHDVIFVISAGNLEHSAMRPEWPKTAQAAISVLAARHDDQLHIPAESIRSLSVAAINPDGLTNSAAGAPARYSRRGPGLRTGVKPDLCHVGGSGTVCPVREHGLFSRAPDGAIISDCGTSYAAPLVARNVAAIAAQIEGDPSSETLLALAIHNASIPPPLKSKPFKDVARQLVGFGQPATMQRALEQPDHQITLLFSTRMVRGKTLEFRFSWPQCLVLAGGKCRGDVRLTLVSRPNLDHRHGDEFVRSNVEAALQQEKADGTYASELEPTYVFFSAEEKSSEADLVEHKFKWAPVKTFATRMPKGRGSSSNWRIVVSYLTRSLEELPDEGIPVSLLLTISDPDEALPVFQEVRRTLQTAGVTLADVRTAARITSRV